MSGDNTSSGTSNAWGSRPSALPTSAPVDRGSGGANHGDSSAASGRAGGRGFFMPKWARNGGTFSPGRVPTSGRASTAPASGGNDSTAASAAPVGGLGGLAFSGLASPIAGAFGSGPTTGGSALGFLRGGSDEGGDTSVPASRGGAKVESLGSSLAELRGLSSSSSNNNSTGSGSNNSSRRPAEGTGAVDGKPPRDESAGRFWGQRRAAPDAASRSRKGTYTYAAAVPSPMFTRCVRVRVACRVVPCQLCCGTRGRSCWRCRSQASCLAPCPWSRTSPPWTACRRWCACHSTQPRSTAIGTHEAAAA